MNHAGAAIPRRRLQEKSREHPVSALTGWHHWEEKA